jgi:hypothetical protein
VSFLIDESPVKTDDSINELKTHPKTPSLEKRRGSLKSLSFQERDLG